MWQMDGFGLSGQSLLKNIHPLCGFATVPRSQTVKDESFYATGRSTAALLTTALCVVR